MHVQMPYAFDPNFADDIKGSLMFHVKWKGFEKQSDMTWEPEKHLQNCVLLRQYFDRLGGRDRLVQDVEDAGRKVSGKSARDEAPTPTETQQPAHMSSTAIPARPVGSWEKDISSIDGCEDKGGGNLVVYVTWKNGSKTRHGTSAMYEHCPQMMLRFYEQHVKLT
ncbi:hypothetical protein PCL_08627 [Purpureocillium lilacinum]|uniref:Chromo domain-containing protein n=1 Tax=Purpureocillium lilacinum TaxID=33203 RepID=A0A2U3DR24_PURLI|nr:hypothetical protein PCL_08627 [Purpureocillium lilacinum]